MSTIHNWISILHDSYEPTVDLSSKLSSKFACTSIQVIGQSTIDTYYLSIHREGNIIRKIYCSEDTIGIMQEGEPFPFEKSYVEKDFFDFEDMRVYCQNFGIDLLIDPSENDREWTIIKVVKNQFP